MRALVVDDSRTVRRILSRILEELGFQEILEAEGGEEGLRCLNRRPPLDLVLVDQNMPDMSGLDFVRIVRGDAAYPPFRLLLVTATAEEEAAAQALAEGADGCLFKPFTREVVAARLADLGLPV